VLLRQNSRRVMRKGGSWDCKLIGFHYLDRAIVAMAPLLPRAGKISLYLDGSAKPGNCLTQLIVLDFGHARGEAGGDFRIGRRRRFRGHTLRSGAWRSAMRPMACQPKKRLTRSNMTADKCWISQRRRAFDPQHHVAGSGSSSPKFPEELGRGQLIFIGSL